MLKVKSVKNNKIEKKYFFSLNIKLSKGLLLKKGVVLVYYYNDIYISSNF